MTSVYDYDNPDFDPLRAVLPLDECDGWMWMNRSTTDGRVVEHYKHRIARGYLNLDHAGQAWKSQIADFGCDPWCDEDHQHRKTTYKHFPVPTGQAIAEVLSWLS